MPKGQQRSNREAKKPKQQKKPAPPAAPFGGAPFKTPPMVARQADLIRTDLPLVRTIVADQPERLREQGAQAPC